MMAVRCRAVCGVPLTSQRPAVARRLTTTPQLSTSSRRRGALCVVAAGDGSWRFDDLSGMSDTRGVSGFDSLWQEQIRGLERAQAEMAELQRQMDQRFEAAQREIAVGEQQASSGSGQGIREWQQRIGGDGGPCGYSWRRSEQHEGPGGSFHAFRSESYTVIGVPSGCSNVAGYNSLNLAPVPGLGFLAAGVAAGFWAAATAAFARRFHLTIYKQQSRWWMVLAWPLMLLISAEFRQQFWQAVRGAASGGGDAKQEDRFVPSLPGKQS